MFESAPTFDDNPLNSHHPGETPVRSAHVTQLRSAIDALRSHKGLGGYQWQAAAGVGSPVTAAPVAEMRAALDAALGAPAGGYAAGLGTGQPILAIHIQELRDRVLGAWQTGGGVGGVEVRWLVADQLGTPRMAIDKGGALSGVTRHDYLPFGEEASGDLTRRTPARGYVGDSVRQRFAGSERDGETGLDFMQARYYSSESGRFISVDPSGKSIIPGNPQTWNRYSYTYNNPLRYVDKNGKWPTGTHDKIIANAFDNLRKNQPSRLGQLQKGSASADWNWSKPVRLATENTEIESLAYRHAMTPYSMVVKHNGNVEEAKKEAKVAASNWINQNMNGATAIYNNSQNRDHVPDAALQMFGVGAHTIMDGSSPSHNDFQVFRLVQPVPPVSLDANGIAIAVIGTVANSIGSQLEHIDTESREPTEDEMNHMVDELRMQYLNAFGREMYEQAVSPEERARTESRMHPR